MEYKDVILLAGYTRRTQAYIQAMVKNEIMPAVTILYGKDKLEYKVNKTNNKINENKFFTPDFSLPIEKTLKQNKWKYITAEKDFVSGKNILQKIFKIKPKLIIYSGYGGEIVPESLLRLQIPFLHVHPGWLPKYRGSTTIYYSWLIENRCGASAFLLEKDIDTGPIIYRKNYPPPFKGIELDYSYDNSIRADLLIKVLKSKYYNGKFKRLINQKKIFLPYYVIHPVLKHLSILKKGNRNL